MDAGRKLLYVISVNHFTNDGATSLISSLFPVALGLFSLDYFQIGSLVAAGLVINVLVQPVVGRYSDRLVGEKLLVFGISTILLSMFMFAFSGGYLALLAAVIVLRAGSSFYHPVGMSTVSKSYARRESDAAMGFQMAFGNLGILTAFILGGLIYEGLGWNWPFYSWAVMGAAAITVTGLEMRGRMRRGVSDAPRKDDAVDGSGAASEAAPAGKFRLSRAVAFLAFTTISGSSAYVVAINFGNLLLTESGLGLIVSNLGVAMFVGGAILGSFAYGRLRGTFSNASLIASVAVIAAFSYLGLAMVKLPALDALELFVAGISGAVANTAGFSIVADLVESRQRGTFFGWLFAFQTLGGATVLFVGGALAEGLGVGMPFAITAAMFFAVAAWALFVRRNGKPG